MYAFQTHNLVKKFGNKIALDNLNIKVPVRCIYGFLGVNGAGKTTTIGIAAKFIYPTSGTVEIKGRLAVIPQDARFYYGRTVESQLQFFGLLSGVSRSNIKKEVEKVLKEVGLSDKRKVASQKLSHGMYKRLGIAQALLGCPEVLLLDEPTAGLDPENAFEIRKLIKNLGKEKTILVSSHNLQEITDICSHIGIIHEGKMIFEGKMEEISKASSRVKYILSPTESHIMEKLLKDFDWVEKFNLEENNILHVIFSEKKISLEDANNRIIKALFGASIGVHEIHSGKSLEESFLEMIGS